MDFCRWIPLQVEMISSGPDWTAITTAIATPIVAGVGAWIAWNQVRASRNALKINLFDRRYAIFESASSTLLQMAASGGATPQVQREFLQGTIGARWLFSEEVGDLLDKKILKLMMDLDYAHTMVTHSIDRPARRNWIAMEQELKNGILPLHTKLNALCAPFLTLSH